ncbi:MAG: fused MFS/spermidine synthase [Planctomycetota bacterium]
MWRCFVPLLGTLAILGCGVSLRAEPKVLCERQSAYSKVVVTEDSLGLRTLRFDDSEARQSVVKPGDPEHLELPYTRAILAGLVLCQRPQRVLVVGLGGGTIPMFLRKHYPELDIDVVDIDPVVVEVAKSHFGFREDHRMRAYVDDGRKFIEEVRQDYDIIFLDAFGADSVPYHLATQEFLEAVRRAMAPRGVVVGNIWSRSSNELHDSMIATYQAVFGEFYVLGVPLAGNEILMATQPRQRLERDALVRRASALSKEKGFRFDLGELVGHAFQFVDQQPTSGSVLKDKKPAEQGEAAEAAPVETLDLPRDAGEPAHAR